MKWITIVGGLMILLPRLTLSQNVQHYNCSQESMLRSEGNAEVTKIQFLNESDQTIVIYWMRAIDDHIKYAELKSGGSYVQSTYTTHYWVAKSITNECLGIYINTANTQATIGIDSETKQILPPMPIERKEEEKITKPPFHGTIFLDPDIIRDTDPNCFSNVVYSGKGERTMFDRRVEKFIELKPYLFTAKFADGYTIEVQVNPEFGSIKKALPYAKKYARAIGFLPAELRKDIQTMWIHRGDKLFGGGNNNILIHTEQAVKYEQDGILEETLVHEASHTSLDAYHAKATNWVAAQKADGIAISTYAKDNPEREDIAEAYLLYFALRYRPDRISEELKSTIRKTIPNRIAYFDKQDFDLFPAIKR